MLSALLSYAYVAFTIEADNAAELKFQHRTARYGSTGPGPWLASAAMWWNCMRYVDEDGISMHALLERVGTKSNFPGMVRWGYIKIIQGPTRDKDIVRATEWGLRARNAWAPIFKEIEQRWRERFGIEKVKALRSSLTAFVEQLEYSLPDCMPILGYGLVTPKPRLKKEAKQNPESCSLDSLLSKALLAFTLLFESESAVSLAICANLLRVIPQEGMAVRDIPFEAGVSKESVATALAFLKSRGFGTEETPQSRTRHFRLTESGLQAKERYAKLALDIEARFARKFGAETLSRLKTALYDITGDGSSSSPLLAGLKPSQDNWRSKLKPPNCLPDFPMVLHRGGYPDGS